MHKVSESGTLCSKKGKEGLGRRNQDVYLALISMFSIFYCEVATNLKHGHRAPRKDVCSL